MFEQLLAIARNTFFESIRQPIVLVVLVVVTVMLILSNPLAAFTMDDDQRMLIDIGLATVFLAGALLAAFVATGVLTREIENKTALTVVAKPVSRPLFVLGKYLGVAAALLLCSIYMSFVFLIVELHQVVQTVRDPIHVPVILFGTLAVILGIGAAVWSNYFYGRVFPSTALCIMTPLAGLAYLFSLMFRHDFTPQPIGTSFRFDLWLAIIPLIVAILVLTAIAIAASARFGQVMTLVITLGVFLFGLMSDWIFGRPIRALEDTWLARARAQGLTEAVEYTRTITLTSGESYTSAPELRDVPTVSLMSLAEGAEALGYGALKVASAIVPNFQVLWLSDAVTQNHQIPGAYVGMVVLYGVMYAGVALGLAVILFQRREVG